MKKLLFICLTFFACISVAQEIDSLKNVIITTSDSDTNKVHALVDLAAIHYHDNLDTSIMLIDQALVLAKNQDYTRGIGFSNTARSGYFFQIGEFDSALIYANKGAEILESIGDKQHILAAYNNIALIYNNMEKPQEAIKIYLKIYGIIENNEPSVQHMAICNNLAVAYGNDNQPLASKEWFEKVTEYATIMNHPMGLVYGLNGQANVNLELNELDEAIKNSKEALEIGLSNGMDKTVIESYQNLGVAYGKMENFAASNDYLNKGLALAEKNNTKQNLVVIYQQLASNYEQSGNYKKALGYTDLYHNLKDSIFNQNKVELIEELEKKYETAELKAAQSQLELEKEQYIKEAELDAIKNDQLIQEKELESLRAKRNQNYLITSIIIAIIVAAAGLLYFFQFKKRKQAELNHVELSEQNKRLQVENQYKDSELKAIKAQMNPHFIFNALNSIQDYIILNEKELASDYLGMFADLMRLYLDQSDQNLISVAEEIKSLKLYIELEALRQDGIEFEVKCNDEDLLQVELPPMLIQPYVENSIKHGLWHKKGDKQLTVSFYEENEMLHCEVLDNGIGITESKRINENRPKHRSFSTDANKNRLQIIQEKHGNDLSIEMTECRQGVEITGTKVIIKIPLNLS